MSRVWQASSPLPKKTHKKRGKARAGRPLGVLVGARRRLALLSRRLFARTLTTVRYCGRAAVPLQCDGCQRRQLPRKKNKPQHTLWVMRGAVLFVYSFFPPLTCKRDQCTPKLVCHTVYDATSSTCPSRLSLILSVSRSRIRCCRGGMTRRGLSSAMSTTGL